MTLADRIRGVLKTPAAAPGPRGPGLQQETGVVSGFSRTNIESTLGGDWCDVDGCTCFIVERCRDPSSVHGRETVESISRRLHDAIGEAAILAGLPLEPPLLFFDLETTGLNGGAGTCAFLIGCGSFDAGGSFLTRQHLLAAPEDERSLLTAVAAELARAGALVSFNGKSFDAPLLETRYLYHRLEWTPRALPHVDMLHVARRFWKPVVASAFRRTNIDESSCSLVALEQQQLGHRRSGDVPGFEIPARYFHFVRSGDAGPLRAVFEHNRLDLLSLAALTARALHLLKAGPADTRDPREALAIGNAYARAGLGPRAREAYQRALDLSGRSSSIRLDALRALAGSTRRSRQYEDAAGWWRQILDVRGCPPHVAREAREALAIHHEHRSRDLAAARTFALQILDAESQPAWGEAVRHRLARLDRKLERLNFEV